MERQRNPGRSLQIKPYGYKCLPENDSMEQHIYVCTNGNGSVNAYDYCS